MLIKIIMMIKTTMTCFFICFTVATKLLWPEKTKCVFSEGKYWIPFQLRNSHLLSKTQQCPSHRTVSSPKSETVKSSTLIWHKRKYFHKSTFFICFFCAKYFILRSIRTAPLGELVGNWDDGHHYHKIKWTEPDLWSEFKLIWRHSLKILYGQCDA